MPYQEKKAIPIGMTFILVDDIGLDLHFSALQKN